MTALFIDDGQETKPHRENLRNELFTKTGIGHCTTFGGQTIIVIEYAGDY